ncbi:MAG: RNA polymerase sigma factor [Oscillospiraceae bacterium]|nr:RNA polymerase sigma factor [Oscillospiraceae bacterium]
MADMKRLFENAVEEYSDMVTGLCLLRLGNRQDAEDCYQNVFLKLYKNKSMLEKDAEHIKAWLIRVTLNECKNRFRFMSRHKTEPLEFVNSFYEDEHDCQAMEQIMSLPPLYRDVIYLHYYSGYSVAELSKLLKSRENTIKSRLKRGRDMLKDKLTEMSEEEELL